MRTKLVSLLMCLFLSQGLAFGQEIGLGIEGTPMLNFPKLQFGDTVYRGFVLKRSIPLFTGGLNVVLKFNQHWTFQMGASMMQSGFSTQVLEDYNYPATRQKGSFVTRNGISEYFVLPISVQYELPIFKSRLRCFAKLGTRIDLGGTVGYYSWLSWQSRDNPTEEIVYTWFVRSDRNWNPSLMGGIGLRKPFKWGGEISSGLDFNKSFVPASRTRVNLLVDGQQYAFTIIRTGTYVGITVGYSQRVFGKVPKRDEFVFFTDK